MNLLANNTETVLPYQSVLVMIYKGIIIWDRHKILSPGDSKINILAIEYISQMCYRYSNSRSLNEDTQ